MTAAMVMTCSIEGCIRQAEIRGLCPMHYQRAMKSGLPRIRCVERHGLRETPTYRSWTSMISRCGNPNNVSWAHYGGRGITICDAWRTFLGFLADMGERPEGKTLDRINNDGNYEPGNCRWATASEQSRNRRPFLRALCKKGHPLTDVYVSPSGARRCRICMKAREARRYDECRKAGVRW